MAIYEGKDLTSLLGGLHTPEARRHCHAVDISESIWNRMEELGINQTQLAKMLGKSCSQVSRILSVQTNMTLQTLSELEHALGITLADTTPYVAHVVSESVPVPSRQASTSAWRRAKFKMVEESAAGTIRGRGVAA